jgi:hypothetical protein
MTNGRSTLMKLKVYPHHCNIELFLEIPIWEFQNICILQIAKQSPAWLVGDLNKCEVAEKELQGVVTYFLPYRIENNADRTTELQYSKYFIIHSKGRGSTVNNEKEYIIKLSENNQYSCCIHP